MAMKKGYSPEVVSSNIKEMMRSGQGQKQAVAAALAKKRKYKMMSAGGMVEGEDEDSEHTSLAAMQIEAEDRPDAIANPEKEEMDRMMAHALSQKGDEMGYAMGGLVQPEYGMELGNKPDEDMAAGPSEPMSELDGVPAEEDHSMSGLSAEAMAVLAEKKKKRKFVQ